MYMHTVTPLNIVNINNHAITEKRDYNFAGIISQS